MRVLLFLSNQLELSFGQLLQVLQHEQYVVPGIPVVSIVVRDSNHEKQFLRKIQHRVIKIEQNP